MLTGEFNKDLASYIRNNGGIVNSSNKSEFDIREVSEPSIPFLENGKMYSFRYFTTDEKFYDTKPLVIGLGQSDDGNQLGINLHYIPRKIRTSFLQNIIKSFSGFIKNQTNSSLLGKPRLQRPIESFIYESVKLSLGQRYNIKHAVKQYKISRIQNPRVIGYENWYLCAVNDENFFSGGSIAQAQALYYKNI